ncbi:MAG: hypothetical protein L6R41_000561 [Letrouitia leprolyta]|nr:MAG: hypothetical protein L6R41_000561 [Letrouitia leprolyta]
MKSSFAYQVCILVSDLQDLSSPLPVIRKDKSFTNHDPFQDTTLDEDLDFFNDGGIMAGTNHSSPFIKDEPDDYSFPTHNFPPTQRGYNMQSGQQFGENQGGSIDPSELMQNNNFGQYNMGSQQQQQMSNSFNIGGSFVNDDELLDFDLNDPSMNQGQFQGNQQTFTQHNAHMNTPHSFQQAQAGITGLSHMSHMNQMYSHTPESAPAQSPFMHGNFNYAQHQMNHASPRTRPVQGASLDSNFMTAGQRTNMPQAMDRQLSSSRSPMTPKTPGVSGLNLGTPESGSLPSQPIPSNSNQHRHHKSLSNQWDSNAGSLPSYGDSPLSSPGHMMNHQISEVMRASGGKHASSLPAKVDNHQAPPAYQSQEAKRRRRRESHNMVERRRRDNINERIQELSHLVPMHRLEDEKVRKHIVNNTPISPSLIATGRSPPPATSLLAGSGGRRATTAGNISIGLPLEEKDKGPNKGDILNGSVSWTRDLMWALHVKIQQESELADLIASLGGRWPFEQTEDEKRMRTELLNAMAENDPSTFSYTRGPGSGLRVPNHTNHAGEPLNSGNQMGTLSPQSLSPGVQSGGSGTNSGGVGQPQYWSHDGHGFKEEDEYGMEMN